jgi:hypothetical protein
MEPLWLLHAAGNGAEARTTWYTTSPETSETCPSVSEKHLFIMSSSMQASLVFEGAHRLIKANVRYQLDELTIEPKLSYSVQESIGKVGKVR